MDHKQEKKDTNRISLSNLYKVKTPEGAVTYLYGTFHSSSELPNIVKKVCGKVSTLILEKSPDDTIVDDMACLLWRYDNPGCYDFFKNANLSNEQIAAICVKLMSYTGNEKLEVRELEEMMNMMTPLHLLQMLSMSKKMVDDVKKGTDVLLAEYARENSKKITGLESATDVNSLLQGLYLTFDEQLQVFKLSLPDLLNTDSVCLDKILGQLLKAYKSGNLSLISACLKHNIITKKFRERLPVLAQKIYDENVTKRDRIFCEKLKEFLVVGDNLSAVGVGHLLGILQFALNSGCEVSMIPYDGNLDEDYPPMTKQQMEYFVHLADYLFRENWFDSQEPDPKVKQHLSQSFFNSNDARKIAKYIHEGKHNMPKDEKEGEYLDILSKNWST